MKNVLFLLLVAGLLFIGCRDSNLNNPAAPNSSQGQQMQNLSLQKQEFSDLVSVSELINGDLGGTLEINKTLFDGTNFLIISATVDFSKGCFSGTQYITATVNPEDASISFTPPLQFDKQVNLDFSIVGLNLSDFGITRDKKVDFAFIGDDDQIELIRNNGVTVNLLSGELSVKNAHLYHFSRYAYIY